MLLLTTATAATTTSNNNFKNESLDCNDNVTVGLLWGVIKQGWKCVDCGFNGERY